MTKSVRTRIAPSPTGEDLHIGNAYTALMNYVFAKKHGGQFIIRIEDTDRTRYVEGSEKRILASLKWLGIIHDEGPDIGGPHVPYRQSDNLSVYKTHAIELVTKGQAYYCFCTSERLEKVRKEQMEKKLPPRYDRHCRSISSSDAQKKVDDGHSYVVRLKVPDSGTTVVHDVIRGDVSFENKLIDDQVLLKSDGYPTYHLGVVVDDHRMDISHVIRGEEWLSSAPKHVLLYHAFGWELPVFAHVPLLRNPDKSKLSKRKNPVWASWYKTEGFLPDAVVNYLALMAWSFPGDREIFTIPELIEQFTLESIQTTAPIFSLEKLRWMNGEYLRKSPISNVTSLINDFYQNKYDEKVIEKTVPLVIERIKTLKEYEAMAGFFFDRPKEYENPLDGVIIDMLRTTLTDCKWTHDAMEVKVRTLCLEKNMKPRDVFMQLRIAITGKTVGPPLLESMEILGKAESLERLSNIK
jgi:glutamyl-tRNA synthetase